MKQIELHNKLGKMQIPIYGVIPKEFPETIKRTDEAIDYFKLKIEYLELDGSNTEAINVAKKALEEAQKYKQEVIYYQQRIKELTEQYADKPEQLKALRPCFKKQI